jgi:Sec-independent protein translocase protein TatA
MTTDKRTQAMRQAWKDFGQSMKEVRTRLIGLKEQSENQSREAKLKQIKQAIKNQE